MTEDTTDQEQGTHFWFMSLIVPNPGLDGFSTYRRTGHFTPGEGTTRFDWFETLLEAVKRQSPELRDAVVLSFDIQPNQL